MCALVKRVQRDDVGHNKCMGTLGGTIIGSGIDIVRLYFEQVEEHDFYVNGRRLLKSQKQKELSCILVVHRQNFELTHINWDDVLLLPNKCLVVLCKLWKCASICFLHLIQCSPRCMVGTEAQIWFPPRGSWWLILFNMVIDWPEVRPAKSDQQDSIKSDLDQFIRLQKEGLAAESLSPLAAGPFSFPRWHEKRVHFTSSSSCENKHRGALNQPLIIFVCRASHTETGKGNREVELGAIGCLVCI
ncbi:hypothetical protein Pyn_14044 [Prunus yedoensis var. nudiflora]|uniref:Uncharacterized protein n=1 Tax=Prunus yedoensis var. nudiflora TaxID=2094558 RepID=A0A314UJB3_PRUYE|nr:hypothetical protein Pyn_14044 [Prunus yedoensis var. nudiflora]